MALCYSRGSIKILQTSYGSWREKEELRQAGFQFYLLNAPNLLAASMPKNNSKHLLILRATQAKVTRHDCQNVFIVGFHCTCKKSPPQTTSWLALVCWSKEPAITNNFLVPWHFVIAGFHQHPANKPGLGWKQEWGKWHFNLACWMLPILFGLQHQKQQQSPAYLASYTG